MTDSDVLKRLRTLKQSVGEFGIAAQSPVTVINITQAAIAEITRLRASPWVSVRDRLPAVNRQVLLRVPAGGGTAVIVVGHRDHDKHGVESRWFRDLGPLAGITHWMPIPPLDQEEV